MMNEDKPISNNSIVNSEVNVRGNLIQNVSYGADPLRYVTNNYQPPDNHIERTHLVEQIEAQLAKGVRFLVIHGDSGTGKSSLANVFLHFADKKKLYDQFGTIPYAVSLSKSFCSALTLEEMEAPHQKGEDFYRKLAHDTVNKTLRHFKTRKLLIIDGLTSEADALLKEHIGLMSIEQTDIIITALKPLADERFTNFLMPSLTVEEALSFFEKQTLNRLSLNETELKRVQSNVFLTQLLAIHIPKASEHAAKDFIEHLFASMDNAVHDEQRVSALTGKILDAHPLSTGELWCLLQLAALPADKYDFETLLNYFLAEWDGEAADKPTDLYLEDAKSYQAFAQDYTFMASKDNALLSDTLKDLVTKGWLTQQEDDYAIHPLVVGILQQKGFNNLNYLAEILNCLRINYFSEQHTYLKDTLLYEKHLWHFSNFIDAQPTPQYLDLLKKLMTFYDDSGDWRHELEVRIGYCDLVRKTNDAFEIAISLSDLCENYVKLMILDKALACGEEALGIAERNFSDSHPVVGKCQFSLASVFNYLGYHDFLNNSLMPFQISLLLFQISLSH